MQGTLFSIHVSQRCFSHLASGVDVWLTMESVSQPSIAGCHWRIYIGAQRATCVCTRTAVGLVQLCFIAVLGVTGATVPVVYLALTHAVMWFVRYLEPAFATTASYTGTVVSLLIAFLALVQYNVCSGSAIECMPVAWRSGAAFITAVACALVDLASIDNASVEVGPYTAPVQDSADSPETRPRSNAVTDVPDLRPENTGLRQRKKGV